MKASLFLAPLLLAPAMSHAGITSIPSVPNITSPAYRWELSASATWVNFNLDWRSGDAAFDEDEREFGPAIALRRVLYANNGFTLRVGAEYQYAETSGSIDELEVLEEPGEIYTLDIANFDVASHRIGLLLDVAWQANDVFEFGLRGGPTLTVFDGDFDGSRERFQEEGGGGRFLSGGPTHESGTKAVFGVSGEAFIRANVTPRVFVEARGGYQWTDDAKYGHSAAVEVENTGWTVGLGVGFKF